MVEDKNLRKENAGRFEYEYIFSYLLGLRALLVYRTVFDKLRCQPRCLQR